MCLEVELRNGARVGAGDWRNTDRSAGYGFAASFFFREQSFDYLLDNLPFIAAPLQIAGKTPFCGRANYRIVHLSWIYTLSGQLERRGSLLLDIELIKRLVDLLLVHALEPKFGGQPAAPEFLGPCAALHPVAAELRVVDPAGPFEIGERGLDHLRLKP